MELAIQLARGTTVSTPGAAGQVLVDIDGRDAVLADASGRSQRRPVLEVLRERPTLLRDQPAAALGIEHPVAGTRVVAPVGGTHVFTPRVGDVAEQWFELDAGRWAAIADHPIEIGPASSDRNRSALARLGDERLVIFDGQLPRGSQLVHGPEPVQPPGRLQQATDTARDAVRMLDDWFGSEPEHARRGLIEIAFDTPNPRANGSHGTTSYRMDTAGVTIDAARAGEHAPWRSPHTIRHEVLHARIRDLLGGDMRVARGGAASLAVEGEAIHEGLADAFASIGERDWRYGEIAAADDIATRPAHRRPDLGTFGRLADDGITVEQVRMPSTLAEAREAAAAIAAGSDELNVHAVGGYVSRRFARVQQESGWAAAEDALRGTIAELMARSRTGDLVLDLSVLDDAFETAMRGAALLARR
ncbi:MAG: hypothetical protein KDC46_05780 [Thermoleophilia bacterium]|nr:hypothetical protein [Thermoleophilia bacterium]